MLASFVIALLAARTIVWHLGGYAFPARTEAFSSSYQR